MNIRSKRLIMLLVLALYTGSLAGCSRSFQPVTAKSDTAATTATESDLEQTIKNRTLEHSLDANTKLLRNERQTDYEAGGNSPFVYPVSLAASHDSRIYISDNNAHAILFRSTDSNALTTLAIKHAELDWPNTIQSWKDSIFVSDNDGIKVFGRDGDFQRVLKTYYGINDFTIGEAGEIYVNPRFRASKKSNPLIVQLDSTGTRVRGFGERQNHADYGNLDDLAYLSAGRDQVVAVFSHRPVVAVFDLRGKLLRQFGIRHPVFDSLAALTQKESFVRPGPDRFRLPTYVAGGRLIGDRILVLLYLPQPEIVELNLQGEEIARYVGKVPFAVTTYRGFDVQRSGTSYYFWILGGNSGKLALFEFRAN